MKEIKSKPFFFAAEEPVYTPDKGITRQFVGYDKDIMMVKAIFEKGAIGAQHVHIHTQTTYVASGKFEMTIDGETKIIQTGDGYYVAPNALHGCKCLEPGILIDVFSPVREDFLATIK
ncbi:MAG: cupin domain-containing protein [Candidatus Azobacteroides sp.]|nr:cupin domain-containing protein [Candidatus Azobacteroides sp.]